MKPFRAVALDRDFHRPKQFRRALPLRNTANAFSFEIIYSQICELLYNPANTLTGRGHAMKLTPFGETVRHLRMRYDASLKSMAEAMQISSSYLSGIEYGERRLLQKHVDSALAFFRGRATDEELANLRDAAARSKDVMALEALTPDARGLVAAFARRLQEGGVPTPEIHEWIAKKEVKSK
ncbi:MULTISPECIES: helix-turn-helix transcriptional regulator [unclassified Burkholderia]|uniref:helix-turn-helix transcriptional regulator n=1 Tax=unclassified Burkholderia TaxID=2613784 RepID=UPI002AB240B8|nr:MULTISPECIES: helix-turn-helix transcriptional regulator [unclassified Burkholderia]